VRRFTDCLKMLVRPKTPVHFVQMVHTVVVADHHAQMRRKATNQTIIGFKTEGQ
jgi:hypothetical protein